MSNEIKSDNLPVKSSAEELNNSASDLMENVTGEFRNSSTTTTSITTSTSIDPLKLHETITIRKDLVNPNSSYEPTPDKDSFSDLKNSELLDSDCYKQTLASVDKKSELSDSDSYIQTLACANVNISHSTNPNSNNQFSSKISDSFKNINTNSEIETLVEFDCDKKDVLNESVCSAYDPFNPTSPNVESDGTDTETEKISKTEIKTDINPTDCDQKAGKSHKRTSKSTVEDLSKTEIKTDSNPTDCDQKAGKSHKRTSKSTVEDLSKTEIKIDINPTDCDQKAGISHKRTSKSTVEDLSKTEIKTDSNPTDCDQKADKSHKRTSKSTVEDLSKTEIKTDINPTADKLKKMTAKSIEDHPSKSEIQPKSEKKETSYKFKILKKESEKEINKPVPYIFLSDSEVEEEDSNNLNEDNVIDLLDEKGCIVANSVCVFICDILDIMKKYVETESTESQGHNFIVYELKESSSNPTEEGKLFISKSITSFIKIIDQLRSKLPVVVMPLQPYMLFPQFNFSINKSIADESKLFVHGTSYKWTHYRSHFVYDWMRILETNDKNINKTYVESFAMRPSFVYPITNAELKGIGIKKRKLEWTIKVNEVILKLVKAKFKMKTTKSADSIKKEDYTAAGCSNDKFCESEKCEIKITNLSESIPNQFYEEMSKKATKNAIVKKEFLNSMRPEGGISERIYDLFLTLSCESYKTIECEKPECDEASCIFYHSEMDRRRNPYTVPYGSMACKFISNVGACKIGDKCQFAHNDYECMFHPFEIYFKLCKSRKTRKQCFSTNPLCPHAHLDSPETFFTKYWNDSLLFGTPLAVEFLVGAISKFNLVNPAYKDTRIFMMGASISFLHNVRKAINRIGRIHTLKHDFVGERDLVFAYVQTLFVADEYDADMQAKINHYFSKNVKLITDPDHKVKFDHDVPCTPFALNALPKWLDTGSNPSQEEKEKRAVLIIVQHHPPISDIVVDPPAGDDQHHDVRRQNPLKDLVLDRATLQYLHVI
ncbi:Zinc finger CCCH domain-containing protein 33 [Armadillidium nasatum]|uniref:Zinc finger CCCH domain-containing protein 33 n=1 Tax=Armadillidium nasatum TaxID=96803 RepID=A0A5N5TBL4_9CRUS|nr:Zinc finger CCCH domain-containing protein 33 [Armadillidium nasatum]